MHGPAIAEHEELTEAARRLHREHSVAWTQLQDLMNQCACLVSYFKSAVIWRYQQLDAERTICTDGFPKRAGNRDIPWPDRPIVFVWFCQERHSSTFCGTIQTDEARISPWVRCLFFFTRNNVQALGPNSYQQQGVERHFKEHKLSLVFPPSSQSIHKFRKTINFEDSPGRNPGEVKSQTSYRKYFILKYLGGKMSKKYTCVSNLNWDRLFALRPLLERANSTLNATLRSLK